MWGGGGAGGGGTHPKLIGCHTLRLGAGSNQYGQLGNGVTGGLYYSAQKVSSGDVFAQVACGSYHTCGLSNAGTALCWGKEVHLHRESMLMCNA